MNTFLPYPDFAESAAAIDYRRLGKQRVEVWQMLQALTGVTTGWAHHTALHMWRGHEFALARFGLACHDEWISRGYVDTTRDRLAALAPSLPDGGLPWWIGDETYRTACRSVLSAKDPAHYGPMWPAVTPGLDYLYPDALHPGTYVTPKSRTRHLIGA